MSYGRGWIGVDLDGTLAMYTGWQGPTHIGEPVPDMVNRVKDWLRRGIEVRIFTARVSDPDPHRRSAIVQAIEDWCHEHVGQRLAVTCTKDYAMLQLWDDRAVSVRANTGEPMHELREVL